MRRALVVAAAVVALGGCTAALGLSGQEWSKAGVDIRQITADEIECVRVVTDIGTTTESYVGGVADAVLYGLRERARRNGYNDCMTSRGYTKTS